MNFNSNFNLGPKLSGGLNDQNDDVTESGGGGIAIDCSSNAEIFDAGALIKSLSDGRDGAYKTTESGILVQTNEVSDPGIIPSTEQNNGSMKFAILIPFDALLWKTASFVVRSFN